MAEINFKTFFLDTALTSLIKYSKRSAKQARLVAGCVVFVTLSG